MPTLAERIQAALERHTAEVASILASASMAEVIAFTQSKGAVASPWAAVPPEPAGPPDDKDPDGEVMVRDFVLSALRLLQDCRGSASVASVLGLRPAGVTTREVARWLTAYEWKGEKVVRSFHSRYQISFEIANSGRDMVAAYDHEHEPPTTAPKADTVSKVDERVLLNDLKAARDRGEKLHPWDEAFLSAYGHEIGLGLPGQEAVGVAYHDTEHEEGPRPGGIQYGAKETGDSAGLGVMRERMQKINEWLKDHPWSTREQICDGVGVTYAQISALDRGDKSRHMAREWTGSLEVKKARSTSGRMVKLYAVRGAEERSGDVGHGSQGVMRDRMNAALAWLAMNPGSTYDQIADGIGTSRRDLLNAINVVISNRDKWKERVEVFGKDKRWMGVARTYRVKA